MGTVHNLVERVCPKCGQTYVEHPAVSRVDNRTLICPECGMCEALESIGIVEPVSQEMRVYISGPISGTDDYMERFAAAEKYLQERGYEVVNPAKKNACLPTGTSWEKYMGESLRLLCECDAIYMLRNSMQSRGAMVEYGVATAMDKEIMMEVIFHEENNS